jgi:glucose-6-phosphate-specific signal transduction histidine kinase
MSAGMKRGLLWTPRILGILFAVFLSLFALDVFDEDHSFWETALALVIHLIPVYVVVIALVLAWRWAWVGAVVFTALAVLYVIIAWGRFHWSAYAVISGPLVLLGVLFLFNWINREQLRAA